MMPTPDPSSTVVWVQGIAPEFFDYWRLTVFAIVLGAALLVFALSAGVALLAFRR